MNSAIERLISLQVSDVMNKDVVAIQDHQTLAEAAAVLKQHHVGGAPVVDSQGKLVGVISSHDFVRHTAAGADQASLMHEEGHLLEQTANGGFFVDPTSEDRVTKNMTTAVQTVTSKTSLINAARCMCAEHIHRLIVTDDAGHVQGVISTLDVLAALINAIEE